MFGGAGKTRVHEGHAARMCHSGILLPIARVSVAFKYLSKCPGGGWRATSGAGMPWTPTVSAEEILLHSLAYYM